MLLIIYNIIYIKVHVYVYVCLVKHIVKLNEALRGRIAFKCLILEVIETSFSTA